MWLEQSEQGEEGWEVSEKQGTRSCRNLTTAVRTLTLNVNDIESC